MIRKYGLVGFPLDHSFSQKYFSEKFDREGIDDASYENFPLESIEEFRELQLNHPEIYGVNVTIPYKESVIEFLDVLSEDAREIRAVNTVCFCRKTGRKVFVGHNTDVIGFSKALEKVTEKAPRQALILGTGGSSKAVAYALSKMESRVIMVSSSGKKGAIGYTDIDRNLIGETDLIVNTTPLGMYPDIDSFPPLPYDYISEKHLLFDLVYNPGQTTFMKKGAERGARVTNGYEMLVQQAEAAWEIWNR